MQLGAVNYLLKPVDQNELIHTAANTVQLLDDIHAQKLQFQESIQALRNATLERILYNRIEPRELREKCQVINISFHCSHMRVGMVKPAADNRDAAILHPLFPAIGLCEKLCTQLCPCYVIANMEDGIAVIFKDLTNSIEEEQYQKTLQTCADALLSELKMPSYTALGGKASNVQEISASYQECILAIEKEQIFGSSFGDYTAETKEEFPGIDSALLASCFESEDSSKIKNFIHSYFSAILHHTQAEDKIAMVKYHLIEFVTCAMQSLHTAAMSETNIQRQKMKSFPLSVRRTPFIS